MKKISMPILLILLAGLALTATQVFAFNPGASRNNEDPMPTSQAMLVKTPKPEGQGKGSKDGGSMNQGNLDNLHKPGNQDNPGNSDKFGKPDKEKQTGKPDKEYKDPSLKKQPKTNLNKKVSFRGTVASVSETSLTINLPGGGSQDFVMDGNTDVHIPTEGNASEGASLKVGVQVSVLAARQADSQSLLALSVHLIPGKPVHVQRVGIVTDYQPGTSITVQGKVGETTYLLNSNTRILPDPDAEIEDGALVTIVSRRDVTGGPLTAQAVVVHQALAPYPYP